MNTEQLLQSDLVKLSGELTEAGGHVLLMGRAIKKTARGLKWNTSIPFDRK